MKSFLARLHSQLRLSRYTRQGSGRQEDIVARTHKEYPRMERLVLPAARPLGAPLADVLSKRRSTGGCSKTPVSLYEISDLFEYGLRVRSDNSRPYPSGGALYPIETYLLTDNLSGARAGAYHYNPGAHELEFLWALPRAVNMKAFVGLPEDLLFSTLLVFTSVWKRSSVKYGDLAFLHALIEAGHMAQNLLLLAEGLCLAARPTAGFDDGLITDILDISRFDEQPIYALILGKPKEV